MIAIACVDLKNGIGKDGNLLISIPEDQKIFRETTRDSVVVMGRKTLFSFKNKEPLNNRINIVFTSNVRLKEEYKNFDNIYFVQNELDFDNILKKYNDKKVFLIGGEKIYFDLIDKCDTALITKVYKEFEADTFFPDLAERGFKVEKESELFTYNDINYKFITYKK